MQRLQTLSLHGTHMEENFTQGEIEYCQFCNKELKPGDPRFRYGSPLDRFYVVRCMDHEIKGIRI